MNVLWFEIEKNIKVDLEKVQLKSDDAEDIIDLFQEVWNDVSFRDSLLIAERYAQWLWTNAFAQDNIDILEEHWLELSNMNKTQIRLQKGDEEMNLVLVEYEITNWLIPEIPVLYVSQLFIPYDNDIIMMSFITEDSSSRSSVSSMFKDIKYSSF